MSGWLWSSAFTSDVWLCFLGKSRALRRPWVCGCGPSSRGHRYWGVPGQGAYVGCDDPAHPWNGHHHEGGVSGYRLRIQGALPTLASPVGSQDLPERAGVASHAHCIGRYARTAAIRRLQNNEITRLRSCLIAGLADCVIAHSGNPKIYNSCNLPIRPPSLHHQQPNPRHQQRHHRLRRRRPSWQPAKLGRSAHPTPRLGGLDEGGGIHYPARGPARQPEPAQANPHH